MWCLKRIKVECLKTIKNYEKRSVYKRNFFYGLSFLHTRRRREFLCTNLSLNATWRSFKISSHETWYIFTEKVFNMNKNIWYLKIPVVRIPHFIILIKVTSHVAIKSGAVNYKNVTSSHILYRVILTSRFYSKTFSEVDLSRRSSLKDKLYYLHF